MEAMFERLRLVSVSGFKPVVSFLVTTFGIVDKQSKLAYLWKKNITKYVYH